MWRGAREILFCFGADYKLETTVNYQVYTAEETGEKKKKKGKERGRRGKEREER